MKPWLRSQETRVPLLYLCFTSTLHNKNQWIEHIDVRMSEGIMVDVILPILLIWKQWLAGLGLTNHFWMYTIILNCVTM